MESLNGLVCFTNCLLPSEDGSLVEQDLWIDERRGVILDAQTQEKTLYPTLLNLLRPYTSSNSANMLGWHAEGPFIQMAKRGAHAPHFLLRADEGFESLEKVYGADNLAVQEDWLMACDGQPDSLGVRIVTAAPEIAGVRPAMEEAVKRGVVFSIGHSIASTDIATAAAISGARLITHLFNAMPQLHHRDPSIIGLLGASPHLSSPQSPTSPVSATFPLSSGSLSRAASSTSLAKRALAAHGEGGGKATSEAFDELITPPQTPVLAPIDADFHLKKGQVAELAFERPFYGLIVDGIHSHPNSVRLAYSAYPEGCILITDAMKILDPNLKDGVHEWRDGKRFVKEGDKLYLEGTDTLAGSVVTLDKCVRNFSRFTGCSLGEAIKCATYNPAKCLGIENRKGTLRPGADADLIVLSRKGYVQSTWVKGRKVWTRSV
ncbi:hypothetical protein PHLCEN_2v7642 [Hermanssonia centrifuga]|uniref:N-acetylglucosamine-6-phosphate deacetylase n=1 Tax=Hermanssonia centrifuga TaxID=98765 RepID=A0A2R6NVZ4_9APHY|nr:hypothetical protein PHLCEN_2v7642 [Hermanssonia centrifuga]